MRKGKSCVSFFSILFLQMALLCSCGGGVIGGIVITGLTNSLEYTISSNANKEISIERIGCVEDLNGVVAFTGVQYYFRALEYTPKIDESNYRHIDDRQFVTYRKGTSEQAHYYHPYANSPSKRFWDYYAQKDFFLSFLAKMEPEERQQVYLVTSESNISWYSRRFGIAYGYCYHQFFEPSFLKRQPVFDRLPGMKKRFFYYKPIPVAEEEKGMMHEESLSHFQEHSNADYFLTAALRPLECIVWRDEEHTTVLREVLVLALYNRDGKKLWCRFYEETHERFVDRKEDAFILAYECAKKILETHGEQINEDLSFLKSAAPAMEGPTLEDFRLLLESDPGPEKVSLFLEGRLKPDGQ